MKRKAIVLLSSIMASALLVGGAFAAYAVTDNADPFGINVTPGDLDVDDTTYVTLDWGESTGLSGIGQLKVGENRKAGTVSLYASQNYNGVFSLSIKDTTTAEKAATDAKLIDYLNVSVYDGSKELVDNKDLPAGDPIGKIVKGQVVTGTPLNIAGETAFALNLQGTPAGRELTVFVTLDSSASPVFTQMAQDNVYLKVDWNAQAGDESTGKVVYFGKPSDWAKVYAYAWEGEKTNAVWPGVEMVKAYNDVYQISVPNDLTNIIFNNGLEGESERKTADLNFTGYTTDTPYWNGLAWVAKPENTTSSISATKNGVALELVDVVESEDPLNDHVYELVLAKGDVLVFKNGPATVLIGGGDSYTAPRAGSYTLYYSKDGSIYVAAPAPVIAATVNNEAVELVDQVQPTDEQNDHIYVLALAANDVVRFTLDGEAVKYGDDATQYIAAAAGNYTFYYSKDTKIYVEAGGTTPTPTPEVTYYLAGVLNGEQCWQVKEGNEFAANTETEGEFYIDVSLLAGDSFKAIGVQGETQTWYPDGMDNEYHINANGNYRIYFRPAYYADWQGHFYVTTANA